ncbi:MAG: molybdopterin cofactor-binding domain-containing protein, partial [Granulosicoccus sp.]
MTGNRLQLKREALSESPLHDSAREHVTGAARYVDDMEAAQGQLHVAMGLSDIAHGELRALDISDVLSAPGVVDIIEFKDLPHATDVAPVFDGDPLLVDKTVSHMGQPLFAVAATSHRAARKAVLKARVDYAELTPELSIASAARQKSFVRPPHRMKRGDSASALSRARHRIKGVQFVGGQEHFYLEAQVARARSEEDGGVTIWSSDQNPTETQHLIAKVLGVPMHRVNVVVRRMGGGFGGKETHATACAAFA